MRRVTPARASLREPLLAFAAATALAAGFAALGAAVPLVRENLTLLIAIVFFLTPVVAMRARAGRDFDYREVGLRADPVGLNLRVLGVVVLLTFPAFVVGFFLFYDRVCAVRSEPLAAAVRADVPTTGSAMRAATCTCPTSSRCWRCRSWSSWPSPRSCFSAAT